MSAQNFRSAFNGFNREDVVHYIEYLNTNHSAEINQLRSELELLQNKLDAASANTEAQERLAAAEAQREEYKRKLAEAEEDAEALRRRCAELERERNDALTKANTIDPSLEERCRALEGQLQAAIAARDTALRNAARCQVEQELEAYRRAERTERVARQRAEQVYSQANGALADATVKVDEASSQIALVTDKVSAQLEQLKQAVAGSKQALADAAATLYTIRPGTVEE